MEEPKITPPAIRLKITGACSRSCFFCHKEGDMDNISMIVPDRNFFECLGTTTKTLNISQVMLTGGEPLLNPHLAEIITGIKVPEITLTTNGIKFKSSEEWKELQNCGLTKAIISMHDISAEGFLKLETYKRTLEWARVSLQNQVKNLVNLCEIGIPTRVNIVVYGDYEKTQKVLNSLKLLQAAYKFEIRLLNDLTKTEHSQAIISKICDELKAKPKNLYQRAGSSNFTQYYLAEDGFEFSTKISFPYFFDLICNKCQIKNLCFEGFYGIRLERRDKDYFIRLCVYKQSPDILIHWKEFVKSSIAQKLKNDFWSVQGGCLNEKRS
jgi:GTP 3',8-cyclase